MTATATDPPATLAGRVTPARVVSSEWVKFRSLRSSWWTLGVALVLTVGISSLISAVTASQGTGAGPARDADLVGVALAGTTFAQLAVGVLGVLVISGEYSTGMIRSSMTVVPRRLPVLWSKIAVFVAVVLPATLVASFVSYAIGASLLNAEGFDLSLSNPGVLRSVIGAALYVTVAGIIALAGGAILRHTAAAISAFVALFFVIPPLTQLLPSPWGDNVLRYLPSGAGGALWGQGFTERSLSPWVGFALLCGYAAALVAVAAWRLRTRDV